MGTNERNGEESSGTSRRSETEKKKQEGDGTHSFRRFSEQSQICDPGGVGRDEEGAVVKGELNVGFLRRAVKIRGGDEPEGEDRFGSEFLRFEANEKSDCAPRRKEKNETR